MKGYDQNGTEVWQGTNTKTSLTSPFMGSLNIGTDKMNAYTTSGTWNSTVKYVRLYFWFPGGAILSGFYWFEVSQAGVCFQPRTRRTWGSGLYWFMAAILYAPYPIGGFWTYQRIPKGVLWYAT